MAIEKDITLAMEPHLCLRLLSDAKARSEIRLVKTSLRCVDKLGALELDYYGPQRARIGEGKHPDPNISPHRALPLIGLNYSSDIIGRWLSGEAAE